MSLAAYLVILSVLWLVWRAAQLWTLPLSVILRHLQIELPLSPRLTIDALALDSVSLHWAPPESHVKKHIILMDGQEVGVSTRGETSVTISGLSANYVYSVQVIAVNSQGFRMASPTTYVRTRPKTSPAQCSTIHPHDPHIHAFSSPVENFTGVFRSPRKRNSLDVKPKTHTGNSKGLLEAEVKVETLSVRMESLKKETAEIEQQITLLLEHHNQEEALLCKRIESLRAKKKDEDEAKSLKEQQHKQLDQQKRELESKRNQAQKILKAEKDELHRQTTDIASFRSSVQNSIETVEHLHESLTTLKIDTDHAVQEAQRNAKLASEELAEIESEIRYLLTRKSESEAELNQMLADSRQSFPSKQERFDSEQAELSWRERESALVKQCEEAQQNLLFIQSNAFMLAEARTNGMAGTETSSPVERAPHGIARKVSRRGRTENSGLPEPGGRYSSLPSFNPDAAPFIVSGPLPVVNDINTSAWTHSISNNPNIERYAAQSPFVPPMDPTFSTTRPAYSNGLGSVTSSIFRDDQSMPRTSSPFARRESPRSSQSGSNPPSPAIQHRPGLPSIFNSTPSIQARNSAGNLTDRLQGTPLNEAPEPGSASAHSSSKWFWPNKNKVKHDPLALDRKNTRSLPKVDVAPIGTKRNRSGSLREENSVPRISPVPGATAYHDVDLSNVLSQPMSREASIDPEEYSTTAVPLPRPSDRRAFGWEPPVPPSQRHIPNPWSAQDDQIVSSATPFDPFRDLPIANFTVALERNSTEHSEDIREEVNTSGLSVIDRHSSDTSGRSIRSKRESLEPKDKIKRPGDRKLSSFVGRVFGKRDGTREDDVLEAL